MSDQFDKRQDRLAELLQRLLPAGEQQDLKLDPEDKAFLDSLGIHAKLLINGLYDRFEGYDFGPVNDELRREIVQLDRLDKEGMLSARWWTDYMPGAIAKTLPEPEPEPEVNVTTGYNPAPDPEECYRGSNPAPEPVASRSIGARPRRLARARA